MSLSIIFLYSDRGHVLTVMNLWMKNLDFIISTKINYPIPAIYFTLGLGVILFLKNCLFLFLEPGPPARSFVTRSLLIQLFPSCSVLCVLDRERFRERSQGTGWKRFRGGRGWMGGSWVKGHGHWPTPPNRQNLLLYKEHFHTILFNQLLFVPHSFFNRSF